MTVLSDLEGLSSAEEFFSYLGVDFDPARLRVARLHILKRMGLYLGEKDFSGAGDERVFAEARQALAQAYSDFVASSPIEERVFKVLQDRDPESGRAAGGACTSCASGCKPAGDAQRDACTAAPLGEEVCP